MERQIHVVRLFMQETGRYGPQYSRPYHAVTSMERIEDLSNRIADVSRVNPTAKIDASLIAGLSGGLILPDASWERELVIPNGWSEQRLRFMMEVHVTTSLSTEIYFFQGYTEFVGISYSGQIDPEMIFYINSFIRINRSRDYSGISSAGYRDTIVETAHVINGQFHSSNGGSVYGLRPEDLFVGVQSSYLSDALQAGNEGMVVDTRVNRAADVFRSRRNNAIPSNFLGRVIGSYRTSQELTDFGYGTEDIYGRAIQTTYEPSPYENPFVRALSERRGMQNVTYFTMNDLMWLDPETSTNTTFSPVAEAVALATPGSSEGWQGATLEVQIATVISNTVTSLMVENMLVNIAFSSTNMTFDGGIDTRIIGSQGVTTADMRQFVMNFVERFNREVMPDITQCGQIPVAFTVSADLYGDTYTHLSIEGGPEIPFITPTFSDALSTPIVTTNVNEYHGLVTGIETIVNQCAPSTTAYLNPSVNTLI